MEHLEKILSASSILLLFAGAGASVLFLNLIPVAASLPLAYLSYRMAEKEARRKGKTDLDQALHSIIETLIEFTGIISAILLIPVYWPVIAALSAFGLHQSVKWKLESKMNAGKDFLGSQERILLIAAVLAASYINSYFLVYGLAFVAAATLLELLIQTWRTLR